MEVGIHDEVMGIWSGDAKNFRVQGKWIRVEGKILEAETNILLN